MHDDAGAVLAATREHAGATDPVIDYEHQIDAAAQNGQPAPAAGWVKELEVRDGALWGRVEWTPRGAAHIGAREYRYVSPTFAFDARTRKVKALHRAALTNAPALDMPALARDQGGLMNPEHLTALAVALGLAGTATTEEVLAKAKTVVAEALAPIAEALGLAKDAPAADIVAKAKTTATAIAPDPGSFAPIAEALGLAKDAPAADIVAKAKTTATAIAPDPGSFVPRGEFDRVATRLHTIETEQTEAKATTAVDTAIAAGKIAPAQRDWALGYARADMGGFEDYAKTAPVIVAPSRIGNPSHGADPNTALTADEIAICRATGVSEEAFRKARAALDERAQT